MILLDTSVVIEIIENGKAYELCIDRIKAYEPRHVHISAITIFEVEAGLHDGSPNIRRRRAVWDRFLSILTYELVTDGVAIEAAKIVRSTAKRGKQIGGMDALIAATAMEWDLTVATRDGDYDRIPGLKVEHWR